jgi:folate-binding protein YgfZ
MADRLSLHDLHAAAGALFEAPCGVLLPFSYGDPAGEYEAVRRGTGLIDQGHAGLLEVTGRDRAAFLHAMLSNDVTSLRAGQGCAATLLDIHGKVQVIVRVWVLEDRLLVVTPARLAARTLEDLDRFLFSEKASFRDASGELALLVLAGPGAAALGTRLTGVDVPGPAWSHVAARIGEAEIRLVRGDGETGGDEVWIVAASADGPRIWQAARDAGARAVGVTARESLRIEAGTPLFGHDVDASVLLPEIPHEAFVSHTKGCYLGQEVVVRIRDRGHVNRHLRGLVVEGEEVPAPGAAVLAGDAEIGKVTSAAWSFGLKRPIALGFVRRQHADPGTAVAIVAGERRLSAVVSALPFAR